MKNQWSKIIILVLTVVALPFLLSAAITTDQPTDNQTRSVGQPTTLANPLAVNSPFLNLSSQTVSTEIVDNNTDNLAQIWAGLKDPAKIKTLTDLRNKGLSFRAKGGGLLRHLAVGKQPIILSKEVSGAADIISQQFLIDYGRLFGLTKVSQLAKPTISRDSVGYTYLRYQYIYKNNVPVWGGEMLVQLDENNTFAAATGKIIPGINLNTKPAYSAFKIKAAAIKIGQTQFKMVKPEVGAPKLYIFNKKILNDKNENKNYLAYKVELSDDSQAQIVILNANTGELLDYFPGRVNSLDRQIYNCNGHEVGPKCYTNSPPEGFDAGRLEGEPMVPERMVNWAYNDVDKSYDYWKTNFMLDGANNQGGINLSKTPIKANAAYADGSGYWQKGANSHIALKTTVSQEDQTRVLYHEYTHAVYEFQGPAATNYEEEDGALDEAYATIFEIATAQAMDDSAHDWDLGWNNLRNPYSVDGNAVPLSHYDSNFICDKRAYGLHINSLVIGHLAYLLSAGGDLMDCHILPLGFDKVQQIFYLAMKKLPNFPDFNDFYDAANQACKSKYDTTTCENVKYAMQVADLDHSGLCKDPTKKERDKDHCGEDGNPIKQTDPAKLCADKGFNCGQPTIFDDAIGEFVTVDCGNCSGTFTCQNYKCVKCEPWTDQQLCAHYAAGCGYLSDVTDNCGNQRGEDIYGKKLLNCGNCTKPKICVMQPKKSYCDTPKNIKGDGGMYDSSGNPAANGGYYKNITIGTQTLFKNNFDGGTQINAPATQTAYQKYCWQNNGGKCLQFGGLYQWHTAMGLPAECDTKDCTSQISPINHRGICPEGFHIPTDGEWSQVEDALKLPDQSCNPDRYNTYDCYNAGTTMRLSGDNDFTAKIFSGIHDKQVINSAYFLSATKVGAFNPQSIYARVLKLSTYGDPNDKKSPPITQSDQSSGVGRVATGKNYLFALRCFADCELADGVWSDWKPIGACGEIKPNIQKQYRSCDNRACGGQACVGESVREVECNPETTCGGLVKAEGGPRDKYGRDSRALYYNGFSSIPSGFKGGGYYGTVQVGEDCWLADNLNVGSKVINDKQRSVAGSVIEKWCYKNDAKQCEVFGGLYSWMEATGVYVDYTKEKKYYYDPPTPYGSEWLKGICPTGWKIPSDNDWKTLLANKDAVSLGLNLLNTPVREDSKFSIGLTDVGKPLAWSSQGFVGNDHEYAINDSARAMIYGGYSDYYIFLSNRNGIEGLPVRCIKSCKPINGQWSEWQKDGECGQYEAYMQRYTRTCSEPKCGGQACDGSGSKEERCGGVVADCGLVPYEGGPYDASGQVRNQGGYYRTVLVRGTNAAGVTIDQCWLRDNLNVGQLVPYMTLVPGKPSVSRNQSSNSILEKYCVFYRFLGRDENEESRERNNGLINCQQYGGLYQWTEAMQLPFTCHNVSSGSIIGSRDCQVNNRHRGICPVGWHIPTDEEWHQLELYYSNAGSGSLISCDADRLSSKDAKAADNCANSGYRLIDRGMSGFDAINNYWYTEEGISYPNGIGDFRGGVFFWTATKQEGPRWGVDNFSAAASRFLLNNPSQYQGVYRNTRNKLEGQPVRCIKDPCIVIDPNDPNYLVATHLGQGGVGFGVYNTSGLPYCDTTSNNTAVTPGASLPPAPTTPSIDGAQLSLSEQVDYLRKIVSQVSSAQSYTSDQLFFISSPQVYLSEYGFTEAQRRLSE